MERIVKPVFWTERALKDLKKINDFNTKLSGFKKAIEITEILVDRVSALENPDFSYLETGSVDESFVHLRKQYRKLIEGNYKITYREGKMKIYINRIFDTRQNPNRNK